MAPELPAFLNVARVGPELPPFLKGGNLKVDRVVLDPPLPPRQDRRSPFKKVLLGLLVVGLAALTGPALLGVDPTNPNPSLPGKVHKQ
jgi:hypothetical protein